MLIIEFKQNAITFCFEIDEYNSITNTITTVTFCFEKNEYNTYNNKYNYNSNTREVTKQN